MDTFIYIMAITVIAGITIGAILSALLLHFASEEL